MTRIERDEQARLMAATRMKAKIFAVERAHGLDIGVRLNDADRAKILRLLRKRNYDDLPVTIELEGGQEMKKLPHT